MLHAAVLRSPHAHARVDAARPLARARAPGVHAAIGPDDLDAARARLRLPGRAGRGRLRRHASRRHAPRSPRSTSSGRSSSRCSTPTRPSLAATLHRRAARARARRLRARPRRGRRRRRGRVPHAGRPAQLDGDAPGGRRSGSATRSRSTSRRSTSGASATRSRRRSACRADKVRVVCNYMGGGFGSKNSPDDYTFVAIELAQRTGPRPCAAR